jgi:hypothetical protein
MEDQAFYTTAAQVIPVLLLVLFVEEALSDRERTAEALFDDLALLALLVFGELTAVAALIDQPGRASEGIVAGALMIGFTFLGIRIVLRMTPHVASHVTGAVYVGVLVVYGILALTAGEEALPLAGLVLFVAASVGAIVARTRANWPQRSSEGDGADEP